MKSFRAHGRDEAGTPALLTPQLRAVGGSTPPRPRWAVLYLLVAIIGGIGTAAHLVMHGALVVEIADLLLASALFAALARWVRANQIALSRLDEPPEGTGKPAVRIIRSRRRISSTTDNRVTGSDSDERVILPYDFR